MLTKKSRNNTIFNTLTSVPYFSEGKITIFSNWPSFSGSRHKAVHFSQSRSILA